MWAYSWWISRSSFRTSLENYLVPLEYEATIFLFNHANNTY